MWPKKFLMHITRRVLYEVLQASVYGGESQEEKEENKDVKKIISKIEKGKFQLDICLLVLSDTEKNQLEIIDPNLFLQKNYPRREYFVVGIAKGFDEALEILEEITKNVYNETRGADIRSYILNKEQEG